MPFINCYFRYCQKRCPVQGALHHHQRLSRQRRELGDDRVRRECFSLLFRKHQRYCLCRSEMLRLSDQATDESYDKKGLHALRK